VKSRRFGSNVVQDCAAKSDGPTMRTISKKDSFYWMTCGARLFHPIQTTISRVDRSSFCADRPTFKGIEKLYVKQIR
jgi:hypothetical protein